MFSVIPPVASAESAPEAIIRCWGHSLLPGSTGQDHNGLRAWLRADDPQLAVPNDQIIRFMNALAEGVPEELGFLKVSLHGISTVLAAAAAETGIYPAWPTFPEATTELRAGRAFAGVQGQDSRQIWPTAG